MFSRIKVWLNFMNYFQTVEEATTAKIVLTFVIPALMQTVIQSMEGVEKDVTPISVVHIAKVWVRNSTYQNNIWTISFNCV